MYIYIYISSLSCYLVQGLIHPAKGLPGASRGPSRAPTAGSPLIRARPARFPSDINDFASERMRTSRGQSDPCGQPRSTSRFRVRTERETIPMTRQERCHAKRVGRHAFCK